MTATALGEQSAMHKTKVSRAVAELERRRWLTRTPDENDRRVEHLTLTKAGLAAYREMVPLAKAFERELLARLSADERAAIAGGVAALEGRCRQRRSSQPRCCRTSPARREISGREGYRHPQHCRSNDAPKPPISLLGGRWPAGQRGALARLQR